MHAKRPLAPGHPSALVALSMSTHEFCAIAGSKLPRWDRPGEYCLAIPPLSTESSIHPGHPLSFAGAARLTMAQCNARRTP